MPDDRFNLDSYIAHFKGGARGYLFYYTPAFPSGVSNDIVGRSTPTYLVRAATLPGSDLEEIMTNWQGYDYKFAGKYTFADWTVTFNVDRYAKILAVFKEWQRLIIDPTSNMHNAPDVYMEDQRISLVGGDGYPLTTYILKDAWPKSVADIALDYSAVDVAQFDVTFSYQIHLVDPKYGTVNYDRAVSKVG